MKQLLFLLLFPSLAMAQYTGNAGQKITLGEQTTADGLVWRGRLADTANLLTNKLDTSVYIVLDTGTRAMWYYRASTTPKWTRLVDSLNNMQGQLSLTTKVTGVLPVANGGTNAGAFTSGSVVFAGSSGTYTQDNTNLFWDDSNNRLGIGTASPSTKLEVTGNFKSSLSGYEFQVYPAFDNNIVGCGASSNHNLAIVTNVIERMRITSLGEVWIGYTADQGAYALQINGTPQSVNALVTTSDEKFKENITPLNKGLEIVNKLKPVTFNFITDTKNNFSVNEEVGFIAQDVDRALSTETFAKSIVNSADDSEPTSTMGLATQNLIPILVKAIQEQNLLIKALEQRILTLENK